MKTILPLLSLSLSLFICSLRAGEGGQALTEIEAFIDQKEKAGVINKQDKNWKSHLPKFPEVAFAGGGHYEWTLNTSEGTMIAVLNDEAAPNHVRNILYLTSVGFYNGLIFHRIIPGFMAQGGCPLGKGFGGPGYSVDLEVKPDVLHKEIGVLSMARSQNPNSAGSQFFITFGPTPNLDQQYSVFGKITEGLDVLEKIEKAGNPNPRSNGTPPLKEITIKDATVKWVEDSADPS